MAADGKVVAVIGAVVDVQFTNGTSSSSIGTPRKLLLFFSLP